MKRTPNRGNNGSNKKVIGSPNGQLGNLINTHNYSNLYMNGY